MANTELQTEKQKLIDFVRYSLGDGMVDVELDPQHYDIAFNKAADVYRQRSSNGVEESYGFLELVKDIYNVQRTKPYTNQPINPTAGAITIFGKFFSNHLNIINIF